MRMIDQRNNFKIFDSQWVLTIFMMVSVFLFSGFKSENFQNSKEDAQIESQFGAESNSKLQTYLFSGFHTEISIISTGIIPGFNLLQLQEFNSRLYSYYAHYSSIESALETVFFFLAKTIPLCSDEDPHFNLKG